eukprot:10704104-Ditylum_brightwellii.AAC.1
MLGTLLTNEVGVEFWKQALNQNAVIIAKDGSNKDDIGSYTIILQTQDQELCYKALVIATHARSCHAELCS